MPDCLAFLASSPSKRVRILHWPNLFSLYRGSHLGTIRVVEADYDYGHFSSLKRHLRLSPLYRLPRDVSVQASDVISPLDG